MRYLYNLDMPAILNSGLEAVRAIQTIHSPFLDTFFRAVTSLGDAEAYIFILPLLFWCIDTRLGAHAGLLFLVSSYAGNSLKDLWQVPRPYTLDPSVKLGQADGYSLPSYHALEAVVMWGFFAVWVKRWWFWVLAIAMMLLIGFSRIYLGVHYPVDILAAYAFGGLFLAAYYFGRETIERTLRGLAFSWQIILSLAGPLFLAVLNPDFDVILILSALSGFSVGLAFLGRSISYDAGGPFWQRVARYIVGVMVIAILYLVPRFIPGTPVWLGEVFRYVGYWLTGWWISFGGPWFFLRLGLASKVKEEANA